MSKVIIVTGASRGIGLAISQHLLSQSHNVVVVARSESLLRHLESSHPSQVAVLSGDFTDSTLPDRAISLALSRFSRLDGLVINHGTLDPVIRLSSSTISDWRTSYDINFFSAVSLIKSSIPHLRSTKGTVILTSSGAATRGYTGWSAYGSSKAALNHLCMSLAVEEPEITCLAIRPGVVDTEMQREIRERHQGEMSEIDAKKFADLNTSGGLLRPEQPGNVIAKLVVYPPRELSGKFLTWNADELKAFQE